jgi:hypothetical protein
MDDDLGGLSGRAGCPARGAPGTRRGAQRGGQLAQHGEGGRIEGDDNAAAHGQDGTPWRRVR